jgi:hypothetical protein
MMMLFFFGIGAVRAADVARRRSPWQLAAALTLIGVFASIYHPVGIPMLLQQRAKPGATIGINGLAGNLGIAVAAGSPDSSSSGSAGAPRSRCRRRLHRARLRLHAAGPARARGAGQAQGGAGVELSRAQLARVLAVMTPRRRPAASSST